MVVQPKYGGGCWGAAGVPLAGATTLHRLYNNNSSATPIQLSDMAAHASADTGPAGDMLDLSFVTEWSDDEGIGSDESVSGPGDKTAAAAAASKRELSVTRFLRVLKQSVRRGPGPGQQRVPPEGRRPAAASAPPSAASAAVFGVELAQHLAATGSSVPGVVREESHGHVSRVSSLSQSIQPRDYAVEV